MLTINQRFSQKTSHRKSQKSRRQAENTEETTQLWYAMNIDVCITK